MRNTGGSGRSKSNKSSSKFQIQSTHTVKSEGPPMKTIQATAEQVALSNLIHGRDKETEDSELKCKISQIMELTSCSQEKAEIALHDNQNDMDKAVNMVLEGKADESEWRESGKKKKKPKQEQPTPSENNIDSKQDKRDNRDKIDKDSQERDRDDFEMHRSNRDQQDNYKRRRNDNKPPRLSRGRGRPDRAGDRPDRDEERDNMRDNFNKDRGFERGRGRGRGGPRRGGRGGGSGGGTGGSFRGSGSRFEKPASTFDNGPQIDTWTNETAVIGEKEPKISNWGDSKDDWNEDIDSWSGSLAGTESRRAYVMALAPSASVDSKSEIAISFKPSKLAETKVFTASAANVPEPQNSVPLPVENALSNTFDLGVLYPKHQPNDISAEASYITQFNQQATESIKNSIGIGSGSSSLSSQTVSNVSALVSLQQNAVLQENMGTSLAASELTANSLVGNGLGGTSLGTSSLGGSGLGTSALGGPSLGGSSLGTNGLGGTSLGNSLTQTSLPVNSLTGSALNSTSLSVNNLTGNTLTGTGLNGTGLSGSLSVSQSISAAPGVIPSVSASQNAMLQQRPKPQKSKLPPPSKIPASAVEMPGHMMTTLDVSFGSLEFGTDNSPFSFGGNESASSAFASTASSSPSTINHASAQIGQVPLSKGSDSMIPSTIMTQANLEQNSPRNGTLYQTAYTTPTKQPPAENNTGINPTESLQMHGATTDLKSSQLLSGQSAQGSLPTTKMDSSLNNYSSNSSYQSTSYQGHKPTAGYSSSTKTGSYPGNQFQTSSNPNQANSGQYSSQYRQSNQNQYTAGPNQYQSGSQFQSPPSGYQSQTGYQSSQTGYQSNQSQYATNPNQFQNFQSGSTFQNQSNFPPNQSTQNSLYQGSSSSTPYTSQSNSLYSQSSSHTGSYSNQSYLNRDHTGGAGSSYTAVVTQASSPFKDNQTGASSYRENVTSSKSNDNQSDSSAYSRDSQSASSFSDSQPLAYNRDSQSVGDTFASRDTGSSSYKRDTKSASGSYPRDSQTSVIDNSSYKRDSQSTGGSFGTGRESQAYKDATSASGYRESQTGSSSFSNQSSTYTNNQTNSYTRDSSQSGLTSGASQSQTGYSAKNFRNSQDLTTSALQTSPLSGSKLADNFSKMTVKEPSLDNRPSVSSQFDVATTSTAKSTASTTSMSSLTSITTTVTSSVSAVTTVTSSNTTKISTLPTISAASSKAPPNLPPGVPLMTQQYIMGQAGTLPFYGVQQPLYANLEDLQYFQQRMPPLPGNNVYDFSSAAAAASLGIPPTTLTSNSNQQTMPNVPYSGTGDSTKMTRVEAQSPTGSIPTSQQSGTGQAHQQQPYFYSYIYPPSIIPGAGFQIPMIPMPQVTNSAHTATPANTQYQQKNYSSHHIPYGANKVYDDLTQQTPDFTKGPYGNAPTQPKPNSSVTTGSAASDIQVPGYGKTHAQAFDKQGFHASTPPPFNLQMAAGQLATGTQAGPLGAPTGPYGAPFVPMMTPQPHSQMLHHHLQDTSSSSRGSQQSGSHSQSKTTSKSYTGSNWGAY